VAQVFQKISSKNLAKYNLSEDPMRRYITRFPKGFQATQSRLSLSGTLLCIVVLLLKKKYVDRGNAVRYKRLTTCKIEQKNTSNVAQVFQKILSKNVAKYNLSEDPMRWYITRFPKGFQKKFPRIP
jgi:hypothetical protein